MEEDNKIVIAVEGKIQLVSESEIKSNSIIQEMAAKRTALPVYSSTVTNDKQLSQHKYLELPRKGEYNKEREESNYQAFQAWLRKKSETELQRRSATRMESPSQESCEEKRRLNQAAFTAWLEKKNARAAAEATAAAVATSQSPTIKYNSSFEEWKKKKDLHQIRQTEIESYQKREVNEKLKRVDPELAKKAYKRLLSVSVLLVNNYGWLNN